MSDSNSSSSSAGIGFFGLLAIVFITLKLLEITDVASWSWWWVLAPLWMPIVFVLAVLAGIFLFAVWVAK